MSGKTDEKTKSLPNILWLCTDQQRFDTLGISGNGFVHTPHLDALAEDGCFFDSAYCQTPVCTPSRASFLTGRYPSVTRARQNGQQIPVEEKLITRFLADNGYDCGLIGKLHLGPCHPDARLLGETRVDDGYNEYHWAHTSGFGYQPVNQYIQWAKSKGVSDETLTRTPYKHCRFLRQVAPVEFHQTTWCAELSERFIRARENSNIPWLLSVNFFDPHDPFDAPEELLLRYNLDEIPLPNYVEGELNNKPDYQKREHEVGAYAGEGGYPYVEMTEEDHRWIRASYWAMVDLIDMQVGRILESLRDTGQYENTIVVFTSDHGEMLGDHGVYIKGPYFYEPMVKVPLIMSWPKAIRAKARFNTFVELVDLVPTLLDAIGLEGIPGIQGRSFWPLLDKTNKEAPAIHRGDVLCQYYNAIAWHFDPPPHATMLFDGEYKIVRSHNHDSGELYDFTSDPNENRNLWFDENYRGVRLTMLEKLCDRIAWAVDPLPEREGLW
jgi:arylsulfatase A-like enzyme